MPIYAKEENITLAIEVIQTVKLSGKKLSRRAAAKIYNVPESSLCDRINNRTPRQKTRAQDHKLDLIEEKVLLKYIIDQDLRVFPPRISGVEDIVNLLLKLCGGKSVGKY